MLYVLLILTTFLGIYYAFFRLTKFKKMVRVSSKYLTTNNGRTIYLFSDENGINYQLDTCLWVLSFDKKTKWESIVDNHKYEIEGYGLSYPSLSVRQFVFSIVYQ